MSFFSRIPGLRILARLNEYIHRPAPLQEFTDYDEYWLSRNQNSGAMRELDRFKSISKLIDDGASVLDIGCGDGSFQQYLSKVRPGCRTLGVDASFKAVDIAGSQGCHVQLLDTKLRLNQQVESDWDVITLMEVIEHVPDAEDLMRQVLELNPGKIFITIPNVGCLKHRFRLMFGGRFPVTTIIFHMKEHLRFWTPKDFKQWSSTFGLEIISTYGQFSSGDRLVEWATRRYPELFAPQIIYQLQVKDDN